MLEPVNNWQMRDVADELVQDLASTMNCSPLVARLLALRGVHDRPSAELFLGKRLKDCHHPHEFKNMERAAKRFAEAINERQSILIHGDFDVDGSTSSTLVKRFCRACGHDADVWIPHRRIDGYGLTESSMRQVAERKPNVFITVDCGIADGGLAQRMEQEHGCDVIITDHHLPQADKPNCFAVVNPQQEDCNYPNKGICGVGIAWKLCWATALALSPDDTVNDRLRTFLLDALSLVAIGTIADCMPMLGENRSMVHHGLRALEQTSNPGLRARCLNKAAVLKYSPPMTSAGR